jgi:hypothetical protein
MNYIELKCIESLNGMVSMLSGAARKSGWHGAFAHLVALHGLRGAHVGRRIALTEHLLQEKTNKRLKS